jgi:tetratricopeptide (TPR) repeat protein
LYRRLLDGGDAAEVFESLGRFADGATAARKDIAEYPLVPTLQAQSHTALGRCLAKLGQAEEAEQAFNTAIDFAQRALLPFVEMLAHRDLIVHVLDGDGRRESQLAALGGAISSMVLPAAEYTAVLGAGLDAESAVAAFKAGGAGAK